MATATVRDVLNGKVQEYEHQGRYDKANELRLFIEGDDEDTGLPAALVALFAIVIGLAGFIGFVIVVANALAAQ